MARSECVLSQMCDPHTINIKKVHLFSHNASAVWDMQCGVN